MEGKEQRPPWVKYLGFLGVIVADLVGYTGAGIALGYVAYLKLGAPLWVMIVTSMLGLSWAMYKLYRMFEKDVDLL